VDKTIQRLVNKGIVKRKLRFRESGKGELLRPQRILRVVKDVEQAAMSDLALHNERSMLPSDLEYGNFFGPGFNDSSGDMY
jgi:hypothetical protein